MSSIPIVGKCFPTKESFLAYLDSLNFTAWRPQYVVVHHTGSPDLAIWNGWQKRASPVTDEQWLRNLGEYYGSPPPRGPGDGPWQHGPHFMFTPKNYGVLSIPTVRGTHAKSFNANSWSVEMVGDFDREPFSGALLDFYAEGLAALHIAAGLQLQPFEKKVRGLHFHRDDPLTSKTCPGTKVKKPELIKIVQAKMLAMNGGAHESDAAKALPTKKTEQTGTVNEDDLSVRGGPGTKNAILRKLNKGARIAFRDSEMNDKTKWLQIGDGEWVAARYVDLD